MKAAALSLFLLGLLLSIIAGVFFDNKMPATASGAILSTILALVVACMCFSFGDSNVE